MVVKIFAKWAGNLFAGSFLVGALPIGTCKVIMRPVCYVYDATFPIRAPAQNHVIGDDLAFEGGFKHSKMGWAAGFPGLAEAVKF